MSVNNSGMNNQADYNIQRMGKAMKDLFNWTFISIFGFWLIFPLFGLVVKAFQLLNCIRDAAASSENRSLQRFYTFYLWHWVSTVIIFAGTFFWIFSLLGSFDLSDPNLFDQIFVLIDPVLLVSSLLELIPSFLSIIAYFAFEDFAKKNSLGNQKGIELISGATNLKYSAIVSLGAGIPLVGLLLSLMGIVLELVGLYKGGQGLQGGVSFGSSPSFEKQYTTQNYAGKNQGTKVCLDCGKENVQNSRFCRSCGSPLN